MVDLTTQYASIQGEIDDAVLRCIRSGQYINGNEVLHFKEQLAEYLQINNVIPCGNATDALQIALMALALRPGDEVIVPAFTYIAPAEAVAAIGATPVVVDVDPDTFNLNPKLIENAITRHTKAIIAVHLFGQSADMEPLQNVASKYNIPIIEDNAQSFGAEYISHDRSRRKTGTMGTIGVTSFFPTKPLGCYGDGGALFTNDAELAERIRMTANHGQSEKYLHRLIGRNSRLDTLQAAVLSVKLKYLKQFTAARQKAADIYRRWLNVSDDCLALPYAAPYATHVYHQFTIQVKHGKRDALQSFLKARQIPSVVYYPLPVHRQEAYRNKIRIGSDLSVSEQLCLSALSLPMHTELEEEQQRYISEQIHSFFNNDDPS
ncbi:MAG: DegT/DnrJ/EryC1/StrS family aminotransferase [Dysgonamonadaceae bacterium]|nr:DegT/DnrJ/EryC1/StrS family aminotransferase [Dysgonamonadaceae bacterium]